MKWAGAIIVMAGVLASFLGGYYLAALDWRKHVCPPCQTYMQMVQEGRALG